MYGPYDPSPVTAGSQPDWYMGFADGALRLLPGLAGVHTPSGFTFSLNVFIPARSCSIPVLYGLAGAYPFLEAWVTGDKREHHLLDRPRNAPTRTGLGVMALIVLLRAVLRRRQRPHRDQAAPVDQRHHQPAAGRLFFVAPAAGVLGHQADLPQPAAP